MAVGRAGAELRKIYEPVFRGWVNREGMQSTSFPKTGVGLKNEGTFRWLNFSTAET